MVVRAVAAHTRVPLLVVHPSQLLAKYTGQTEERIRALFAQARAVAPCVMCLEDAHLLAMDRDRAEVEEDSGGASQRAVATLLNELDGIDASSSSSHVFFVASSDRPWLLDSALLRPGRLDRWVY